MIEDSCCIELNLKQRCTDREGKIIKIESDDLYLVEVELLKVRWSIYEFYLVKEVCKKHKNKLLRDHSVNFKKCEDPFKKHKTSVKTNLHEVSLLIMRSTIDLMLPVNFPVEHSLLCSSVL